MWDGKRKWDWTHSQREFFRAQQASLYFFLLETLHYCSIPAVLPFPGFLSILLFVQFLLRLAPGPPVPFPCVCLKLDHPLQPSSNGSCSSREGPALPLPLGDTHWVFLLKLIMFRCCFFLNGRRTYSSLKAWTAFLVHCRSPSPSAGSRDRGSSICMYLIEQSGIEGGETRESGALSSRRYSRDTARLHWDRSQTWGSGWGFYRNAF